jgi:hypothetical protein
MTSDDPLLFGPFNRGHKEKERRPNGQKTEGSSEAIKRTDNPMDKRQRVHQRP